MADDEGAADVGLAVDAVVVSEGWPVVAVPLLQAASARSSALAATVTGARRRPGMTRSLGGREMAR